MFFLDEKSSYFTKKKKSTKAKKHEAESLYMLIKVECRTGSNELPYKVKEELAKNKPERMYRWICTMSATLIKY